MSIATLPLITALTPIQKQYFFDPHRFIVVTAGRRSRKTLIGTRKVILAALDNPGKRYFLGAPTHQQAKAIFWSGGNSGLQRVLPPAMRWQESHSDLWVGLRNGAEIHVVGLDRPQRIEGQPWDGCQITEIDDMKPGAWGANIRPLLSDTNGFAILDGVPEGQGFGYERALYACDGVIPPTLPGIGAYGESKEDPEWCWYSWLSSDVLRPEEIAAVRRELDERTYRQEYEGSFETAAGRAYYAFSADNVRAVERGEGPWIIGMDFNVDPMTAVLCREEKGAILQWGEVWLSRSNTYEMVDHLARLGVTPELATIYPDSTGAAETSNATKSDLSILRQNGYEVRAHAANPRQRDRLVSVNSLCRAVDGQRRYFVDPSCKRTINDLQRVQCLPDGRIDKTAEKTGLVHISDALGYAIHYLHPARGGGLGVL